MIHIYQGNGKGKTTCAIGLAVRAAGHGFPVIFSQFLKNGSSGEIRVLEKLSSVILVHPKVFYGFLSRMTPEQRTATVTETRREFSKIREKAETILCALAKGPGEKEETHFLIIMDEVLDVVMYELLPEEDLLDFLDAMPENTEVVLTGRRPSEAVAARADYITSFEKLKHPFDKGIPARPGIEF